MRLYQCHLEREFKPFQWVGPKNIQVGPGRLEPISKVKTTWAMIKDTPSTPSRIDPWPERSMSVQWRTERPPEVGRPAPRRPPGPKNDG